MPTIHGLRYGPYRAGEDPNLGIFPTEEELAEDIQILSGISNAIGTYSMTHGLEKIVELASATGHLPVVPTAWQARETGADQVAANAEELSNLESAIDQYHDNIPFAIVGNETL